MPTASPSTTTERTEILAGHQVDLDPVGVAGTVDEAGLALRQVKRPKEHDLHRGARRLYLGLI